MEKATTARIVPPVIIMDVYGTLLDMHEIEKRVNDLMRSKRGYTLWSEVFMEYCFVDNCIEQFNDFPSIAKSTLQMTGKMLGHGVSEDEAMNILELLKYLPVHERVAEGLSMMLEMGSRLVALTNADEQSISERMEKTGLVSYFEKVLSSTHVKRYKPSLEVYNRACRQMNISPSEAILISIHGWDIAGAANAGMQTAYLNTNDTVLYPLAPQPDIVCRDLVEFALHFKKGQPGEQAG